MDPYDPLKTEQFWGYILKMLLSYGLNISEGAMRRPCLLQMFTAV